MKIRDLLSSASIVLNGQATSKAEALEVLFGAMEKAGNIADMAAYKKAVLDREALSTTGVGEGVAIPHGQSTGVAKAGLSAMTVKDGVEFESLDGQPAKLFFMIAAPKDGGDVHLAVLARLSQMLMDEGFRNRLINAQSTSEFLALIDEQEAAQEAKQTAKPAVGQKLNIVGVTACPTGIAHTYMAQEALEVAAKELGYVAKIETDGSGGAKNVLTKAEIAEADAVIIAADKNVDMARFDGKRVISVPVAKGIHEAKQLVEKAMAGEGKLYTHSGAKVSFDDDANESVGRTIYKHLMNGVSNMLPFVIGGGILIALAFLFDMPYTDASNYSSFGGNSLMAKIFNSGIGGIAFGFMLPVLAGFIAQSIADRPGLAPGFVGGGLAAAGTSFSSLAGNADAISGGFLGALFAGFFAGYAVKYLAKLSDKLPRSLEGTKPTLIYPLFGTLAVGLMMLLVNPIFATINIGITGLLGSMGTSSKLLLGIVLGAMMAVDMGGPVNKAAYVFGLASLESGNFDIMAAVMAGGMVPPLAIALSTTFFPRKYSQRERDSGITNFIMGLSFITEGAIPFAAADPIRVIPSIIAGSAVAGGLSMMFGCMLRAPHGGIFVVATITNPFGYLIAVAAGAIVGMVLLSILKKDQA